MTDSVVALDVGGTKVAAGIVTAEGEILARQREATSQDGPEGLVSQLARLVEVVREEAGAAPRAIGIAIPAVLEPDTDRVVWAPNLRGFRDVDLRGSLESILGLPVYLEYDGHASVLGEWWRGAACGVESVVFTIIGTGIGGGMILGGRLHRGRDRLAGAAGWFALTTEVEPASRGLVTSPGPAAGPASDGPLLAPSGPSSDGAWLAPSAAEGRGRSGGHWEQLAAGPGIARRALASIAGGRASTLRPDGLTAEGVFAAARAGDTLAREIVAETAEIIGIGVANIVSLVNPDMVVLGGGVGTQADLILERVRRIVGEVAQPISAHSVRIECSALGDNAGLLGAALAAFQRAHLIH